MPIAELLDLKLAGPKVEAIICWHQSDMDGQQPVQSDRLEYANFWDIKEEGVEEYLVSVQGSRVPT